MRLLLVTPYSPFAAHRHAATDMLADLVTRISAEHELHIVAPRAENDAEHHAAAECGCELWPVGRANSSLELAGRRVRGALGTKPYWLRLDWTSSMTRETLELAKRVRPDIVHCEYLQTGEVAIRSSFPTIIRLHDVTTSVMRIAFRSSKGIVRAHRAAELWRTSFFERRVLASTAIPVALSEVDAAHFRAINPRSRRIPPGISIPAASWSMSAAEPQTVLFFGAMWRRANEAAAVRLAQRIMPLVWASAPNARLRIVGAAPSEVVLGLGVDPRVEVRGWVDSIEEEVIRSAVVACPTVFGGGILMKLLRAFALGAPVVADQTALDSVGATSHVAISAESDREMAVGICELLAAPTLAAAVGALARKFVADEFAWPRTIAALQEVYESAICAA